MIGPAPKAVTSYTYIDMLIKSFGEISRKIPSFHAITKAFNRVDGIQWTPNLQFFQVLFDV
jgi:hypothetical protein